MTRFPAGVYTLVVRYPRQTGPDSQSAHPVRNVGMLLIIAILLLLIWGGGLAFHIAGGLIHLLLLVAVILFVLHLVRGGRSSV